MNANDKIAEPRTGNSALIRPRYTAGLMLQDDDLTQAVTYTRDLNRLLFRSLLGCGVICGLVVKVDESCGKVTITIAPGVALDCAGDALQLTAPQTFVLDPTCKTLPPSMCIVIRYHERSCLPRSSSCSQEADGGSGATRINEGYELRVISACPDCGCGCGTRVIDAAPVPTPAPPPVPTPEPTQVLNIKAQKGLDAKKAAAALAAGTASANTSVELTAAPAASAANAATPATGGAGGVKAVDCRCIDLSDPVTAKCYADHYAAKCSCCTDCEWLTLARVLQKKVPGVEGTHWVVDHSVRRLIRPVLMRDAQAEDDLKFIANGPRTA